MCGHGVTSIVCAVFTAHRKDKIESKMLFRMANTNDIILMTYTSFGNNRSVLMVLHALLSCELDSYTS